MARRAVALALPPYPGRVVLVGRGDDGARYWCYAVTGRSPESRARTVVAGPEELRVVPTDPSGADPLRHYACVVRRRTWTVVGNGDHVALLAGRLATGTPPAEAFADVLPEPDAPHFTPRVAALVAPDGVWLARSAHDARRRVQRSVRAVAIERGEAWVVHAYRSDGETVHAGPRPAPAPGAPDAEAAVHALWDALDPRFRIFGVAGLLDGSDPSEPRYQVWTR